MDSLITPFMFHIDTSLWSIEKSIAFWLTILLIGFGILFVFLTPDTKLTEEQQKNAKSLYFVISIGCSILGTFSFAYFITRE